MVQKPAIKLDFFASGYCEANAKIANPQKKRGTCRFYALWALIEIKNVGYVLFDSGYSEAFQTATHTFPERFYRWATPMYLKPKQSAKEILEERGISVSEIRYIIISHFHADHIGGLQDFPQSQFICSKSAYQQAISLNRLQSVRKAILPKLIPDDFNSRCQFLEDIADEISINNSGIEEFKIFGLENFKLISLPGHAKDMLGFIFSLDTKKILYATDASWSYEAYHNGILPNKIVKLFFDSWPDFIETQQKLKDFESKNSNFNILFTHCVESLNYLSHDL